MAAQLNLRPIPPSAPPTGPRPPPSASALRPWQFSYAPSADGFDCNLLILFHGLGDDKASFFELGKSLKIPGTAILSLQAPLPVPLMDHPSFSWYNTFGPMFESLPNPNPTPTVALLRKLITALNSPAGGGWAIDDIHLFGWGQGGTIVLELALDVGKVGIDIGSGSSPARRFGSATSICGPLLSYPTSHLDLPTLVCYFTRNPKANISRSSSTTLTSTSGSTSDDPMLNRLYRAFKHCEVVVPSAPSSSRASDANDESMLKGREWEKIVQFWLGVLKRPDQRWKGDGEVFEVVQ